MKWTKVLSCSVLGGALLITTCSVQADTIQDAVNHMLQTNPDIRANAFNRLGRDEEVRKAKSGYYPTLDIDGALGYQDIQEPIDDELSPKQARLSLRQNVFRGFATQNEVDRQEARVRSSAYRVQSTSERVALRGSESYLNVLRRMELADLAELNLQTHLRISDQIGLRVGSGVASQADSDQVTGRVALAESNVVVTTTNLLDAKSNYLSVVGIMPKDLIKPKIPADRIPASIENAEKLAIDNNTTLKTAMSDLEARMEQQEVAKSPYYPVLDIELDQTWDEDLDEEGKDYEFLAFARLRYNLFNGFFDQARKAETKQLVNEAREIRNSTHRQVIESIRLSWMAYQAELNRIGYLEKRVVSTKDTATAYVNQFDLGKRSLLDVLDTEAEVIGAQRDLVDSKYNTLFAQYRILAGMGMLVATFNEQWPEESTIPEQSSSTVHINEDVETFESFAGDKFTRPEPPKEDI